MFLHKHVLQEKMDKWQRRGSPRPVGSEAPCASQLPFQCSQGPHSLCPELSCGVDSFGCRHQCPQGSVWSRTVPSQAERAKRAENGGGRRGAPGGKRPGLPGQDQAGGASRMGHPSAPRARTGPHVHRRCMQEQVGPLRAMEPRCSPVLAAPCSEMGTQGSRSRWLTQTRVLRRWN